MAFHLLHGTLDCTIYAAENLVNEFRITGAAPGFLRHVVGIVENAVHLGRGPSRLYATVDLGKARVGRTRMVEMEPVNPVWMENFYIYCAHYAAYVVISVKDDDLVGSHVVGRAKVPVRSVLGGSVVEGWYNLYNDDGTQVKGEGRIRVRMQFWPAGSITGRGGQRSYFPQRTGCRVKLYQDAHMREEFMPKIFLQGGQLMEASRCWEDVYEAITGAQIFIYIAGWSVYPEIRLRRRGMQEGEETFGELLKRKAEEGVSVLLLVWDDRTSTSFGSVHGGGVMGTKDEETAAYFRQSKVRCVLCPRSPEAGVLSATQALKLSTMFTHHQKLLCVDGEIDMDGTIMHGAMNGFATSSSGTMDGFLSRRRSAMATREVISFVGGIDLCHGRYDDQKHSLFRTLNAEHADDFYQGCFRNSSLTTGGPRQPWHDIHCRLRGPVALDVVHNFEQRWRKQGHSYALVDLSAHQLLSPSLPNHSHDSWNAHLLRSIDGGAAFGFPDNPADAADVGLVSGKDNVIERSIQDAYILAIRQAEHFLYIENQYFLGSCHAWDSMKEVGCLHLIPMEIVLKIVSKIEADERFVAYIVIPMWPEGYPESQSVQAILEWQRRTMEMMYKQIALALHATGKKDESPTDYLTFFCLGNREIKTPDELPPHQLPENLSHYRLAQENRRFMIYVHSKMMIVDDEYIIVGSANINQRSMDGGRDTEIAIGAHQPFHSWAKSAPRGQIHGFRMSLWYEHLGRLNNCFLEPWSLKCVRYVNQIATELWDLFVGHEPVDLPGHLLTYPLAVSQDGSVTELPGQPYFPDTKASVLGKQTPLPPILTT